jgi:hypothetical protein
MMSLSINEKALSPFAGFYRDSSGACGSQKGARSRRFSVTECFRHRVSQSNKSMEAKLHGKHKPSSLVTSMDRVDARPGTAFRGFQLNIMADVISCEREMPMVPYVDNYCVHVGNHPFERARRFDHPMPKWGHD